VFPVNNNFLVTAIASILLPYCGALLLCCEQVIGVVNITTLTNRQYCVVLDPVDAKGNPQFGRKKLVKGEKTFFLMPGERLEKGIQNMYILGEDEGLILKAVEGFVDSVRWRHVDTCCGCMLHSLLLNVVIFSFTRQSQA